MRSPNELTSNGGTQARTALPEQHTTHLILNQGCSRKPWEIAALPRSYAFRGFACSFCRGLDQGTVRENMETEINCRLAIKPNALIEEPSPIADTSRLLSPGLRFCIVSPSECFSHLQAKVERRGTGILILPIHCLFLSLPTISCRSIHDSALFLIHKGALRGTGGKSEDYEQRAVSHRS